MEEWALLSDQPHLASTRSAMLNSVESWWDVEEESRRRNLEDDLLDRFDVTYRIRRLQFVIRRLNQHGEAATLDTASRDALDEFKQVVYRFLDDLYELRRARQIEDALIEQLYQAARQIPLSGEDARNLLNALSESLDLKGFDRKVDAAFVKFAEALNGGSITQAFLSDYVGFPVYDVLLYTPGSRELGPDPLTRIRVDRISPEDTDSLSEIFSGLKSRNLMGFLGFFNREYREHDYLWGRLNSADRLVDLLSNVAPEAFDKEEKDRFKTELFKTIVQKEKRRLYRCDDELRELDELLAKSSHV